MKGTPADLHQICERIIETARSCGDLSVEQHESSIELRAPNVFAVVEVRRSWVDLHLKVPGGRRIPGVLKLLHDEPDIEEHTLRLRTVDDVDDEIRGWLSAAHAGAVHRGH